MILHSKMHKNDDNLFIQSDIQITDNSVAKENIKMSTDHYYKLASQTANKYKSNRLKLSQGQIPKQPPTQHQNQNQHRNKSHNDYELEQQQQHEHQHMAIRSNRSREQEHSPSQQNIRELKTQNTKLKKLLKQTQAKRISVTKQCSELANKYEKLEEQNMQLHRKIKDVKDVGEGDKFRSEELRFLNKELSVEIEQLRKQNQVLNDKLKHHAEILEKKYQELESRTYKRIEQALKRIKKGIHYLTSLSSKQIQKTKEMQIQNLTKASQILKGKYNQNKFEDQIEQLMNPIRNIQQQLHQKQKQFTLLKQQNMRLNNQVKKHKKIEKQLLPQYKQAIDKLKKNLGQVRMQLSENQYEKCQLKKKYEQKNKQTEIKYDQLFKQFRKLKLQNKIFEKKIQQMQDDVEQQKQRLMGENELLKKLYKSDHAQISKNSLQREIGLDGYVDYEQVSGSELQMQRQHQQQTHSYKTTANHFHKNKREYLGLKNSAGQNQQEVEQEKKGHKSRNFLKKNYSASQLRAAISHNTQQIQTQPKKRDNLKLKQPLHEPYNYPEQNVSQSRNRTNNSRAAKNYTHLRHTQQMPTNNPNKNASKTNKLEPMDYYNDNPAELLQKQARKHDINKQPLSHHYNPPTFPNKKNHNDYQIQHDQQIDHEDGDYHQSYDDQHHGDHLEQLQQSEGYVHDEGSSSLMSASQDGLKNQIFKIDQQIMEIQKTLDRELNMYK